MSQWEYTKRDLNALPRKAKDMDLLNSAEAEGCELVAVTGYGIAYLKRAGCQGCAGSAASAWRSGLSPPCLKHEPEQASAQ
jgi:hypothetical protein